jgi:hypothetical protein
MQISFHSCFKDETKLETMLLPVTVTSVKKSILNDIKLM